MFINSSDIDWMKIRFCGDLTFYFRYPLIIAVFYCVFLAVCLPRTISNQKLFGCYIPNLYKINHKHFISTTERPHAAYCNKIIEMVYWGLNGYWFYHRLLSQSGQMCCRIWFWIGFIKNKCTFKCDLFVFIALFIVIGSKSWKSDCTASCSVYFVKNIYYCSWTTN